MLTETELQQHYRYCCTLTKSTHDAWDLLQTGIEKFLRKPPQSEIAKHGYFRRILRNQFYDNMRHAKRWQTTDESAIDLQATQDFDIQTLEDVAINQDLLETIWAELDPVDCEILYLWAVDGYSTTEVATLIDMPRGTLLSRIHRLRNRLQQSHPELMGTVDKAATNSASNSNNSNSNNKEG